MTRRKDGLPAVPVQHLAVHVQLRRQAQKAAVRLSVHDHALRLPVVVGRQQAEFHARMQAAEARQDLRQPFDRDARKARDAYRARIQTAQFLRFLLQFSLFFAQRLHARQQSRAVGCEGHAALAADQQVQTQFLFQRRHGVAHAGLRDVQFLARPGKAAQLDGLQKHFVFRDAHGLFLSVSSIASVRPIHKFYSWI